MTSDETRTDTPAFNLWDDPWIRVLDPEGTEREVSIATGLTCAHQLASLHDPSPLVVVGIHRLLVAILQSIYDPQVLADLDTLLRRGCFAPECLAPFADQYRSRFDLFHATAPFLQTGDVPLDGWRKPPTGAPPTWDWKAPKSVASLFPELPAATNRTLFHHATDATSVMCPACCARGLLTIPPFASSGGSGIHPSINGVPPVYVLPIGATLFESLTLSFAPVDFQPRVREHARATITAWTTDPPCIERSKTVASVGYIESLLFPARRVRLYRDHTPAQCTQCGGTTADSVRQILFEMGHLRGKDAPQWDDPFVAFVARNDGLIAVKPQAGKALWREYTNLLLTPHEQSLRPKIVQQISNLVDDGKLREQQLVQFRCVGLRTDGKAKIFEWVDESLEVPLPLLTDIDGALLIETALRRADEVEQALLKVFAQHFRPERSKGEKKPNAKQVRFKTLQERLRFQFWHQLEPEFRHLVRAAGTVHDRTDYPPLAHAWADTLVRIGLRVFCAVSDQVGTQASALKVRIESQDGCRQVLFKKRKEWKG